MQKLHKSPANNDLSLKEKVPKSSCKWTNDRREIHPPTHKPWILIKVPSLVLKKCYVSEAHWKAKQTAKKDVGFAMHDIIWNYAFKQQYARH